MWVSYWTLKTYNSIIKIVRRVIIKITIMCRLKIITIRLIIKISWWLWSIDKSITIDNKINWLRHQK